MERDRSFVFNPQAAGESPETAYVAKVESGQAAADNDY